MGRKPLISLGPFVLPSCFRRANPDIPIDKHPRLVFQYAIEYFMSISPNFKKAIYEQLARIGKAVASPPRLELLDLLCQGPRTVEALAQEAGLTVANASQHLQVLRSARLVEAEKQGLYVTYRLADVAVCGFFQKLRALAEIRLAEVESLVRQLRERPERLEPVEKKALLRRVRRGEVVVLDVRPPEEYKAGHIPGALSIPLKHLKSHLSKLPRNQDIVAYCRGPYCVLAAEAVEVLKAKGFRALRLEDGVPEWRAHGLPVAVGDEPRSNSLMVRSRAVRLMRNSADSSTHRNTRRESQ